MSNGGPLTSARESFGTGKLSEVSICCEKLVSDVYSLKKAGVCCDFSLKRWDAWCGHFNLRRWHGMVWSFRFEKVA